MKQKRLSKSYLKKLAKLDFWTAFYAVHGSNVTTNVGEVCVETKKEDRKDKQKK